MQQYLLDLPLELQVKILSYLSLMDVCLLMQVPALEPCILARLPRDEIHISNFRFLLKIDMDSYYHSIYAKKYFKYNGINLNSRNFKIFCKFLCKVRLSNPIKALTFLDLCSENVKITIFEYLGDCSDNVFETIYFPLLNGIRVSWVRRHLACEAYCLSRDWKLDHRQLWRDLVSISDPSTLESQRKFLTFCFCTNAPISNIIKDFANSRLNLTPACGSQSSGDETLDRQVLSKFRNYIMDYNVPIPEAAFEVMIQSFRPGGRNEIDYTQFSRVENLRVCLPYNPTRLEDIDKLKNLRYLQISENRFSGFTFHLSLPKLSELEINAYRLIEVRLSHLPELIQFSASQCYRRRSTTLLGIPTSIKSLKLRNIDITPNLIFTRPFKSLVELSLTRIKIEDFPHLKDSCPALKKLIIDLNHLVCDACHFATYLPNTISRLFLFNGHFHEQILDFSGLPHLKVLKFVISEFVVSNVIWGRSITSLKLLKTSITAKDQGQDFLIGNGILNQLQQLTLKFSTFVNCNLVFGPDSMLQALYMFRTITPRVGLCANLKYLEILQDFAYSKDNYRFSSDQSKNLNDLQVYMDFRYTNPADYGYWDINVGTPDPIGPQSASEDQAMENYTTLKNLYGCKTELIVFVSLFKKQTLWSY